MSGTTRETKSTCPYCGVGCGVIIESQGAQITGVRGDPDHPANFGRLCSKGQNLALTASASVTQQQRLLQPLRRLERSGPALPVAWDVAMGDVAQRFAETVLSHGPDAVGFYLSGQLLTEDYYVFNKLVKGLLNTNNVDTNSRLCMSSAVAGYKATLGADAPPACYDDLNHAGTVFITGANTAWAHPVLFRRLEDARAANPQMKLIVADPRRTETAAAADLHLQLLPGTDVALHHGLLHVMLWEGLTDTAFISAHTSGFEALRERVREFTPAQTESLTGVPQAALVQAARWFAGLDGEAGALRRPALSLYCQGLNQSVHGTDNNVSLINLHLATGQIGKPGAGPFSLTGQPNAMGGREVGGLANLLSAHRSLDNPAHRAEVAALWGVADVPAQPGKAAVQMFEAAADGEIKALWIACTNPAQSMPSQATVRAALQRAEFVVLQEAFAHTATAAYADLLLPATTWGEKEGTVTNSERCISRVRAAVAAPGQARNDWAIGLDLGQRLEQLLPRRHLQGKSLFAFNSAEDIWNEHRESTRGRDLDITGLTYSKLETPQQWPCPEGQTAGLSRLYEDHHFATPDGRARFGAPAHQGVAEPRDARFPFALTTGRLREQWHGMSRTGTLAKAFGQASEPCVQMTAQDMRRRGLQAGQLVKLRSRQGELHLPVQASAELSAGQAFIAMHWGSEFAGGLGVNGLMSARVCPQSQQPELKHVAVRVEPAPMAFSLVAAAWLPQSQALAARGAMQAALGHLPYASCVLFGREPAPEIGVLVRAAAPQALADGVLAMLTQALQLDGPQALHYTDPRHHQQRCVRLGGGVGSAQLLRGFLLAGDTRAQAWLLPLLQEQHALPMPGRMLLLPTATAPVHLPARSEQICNCLDVSAVQIQAVLAHAPGDASKRLASMQAELKCGTQCGSCLPRLRDMAKAVPAGV